MHRHANIGKKFGRLAAPRRAMMRGLLDSLILYERIETTEVKAKELARVFDKLVTKAKKQDLHNYRQIQAETLNPVAAEKLFKDLAQGFAGRTSGYTRVIKTGYRLGDAAKMAVVELILDEGYEGKVESKKDKVVSKSKPATKSTPKAKTTTKPKTTRSTSSGSKKKATAGASK